MDWYYIDGITPTQAHHLILLDDLRESDPVTWALVLGLKTSESISRHICWPHTLTLHQLRQYKSQGLVWDTEGRRAVIWTFTPDMRLAELQLWVYQQRRPGGIFVPQNAQE